MRRTVKMAALGAAALGLAACTNPYSPGQRAVGGGLLGAGRARRSADWRAAARARRSAVSPARRSARALATSPRHSRLRRATIASSGVRAGSRAVSPCDPERAHMRQILRLGLVLAAAAPALLGCGKPPQSFGVTGPGGGTFAAPAARPAIAPARPDDTAVPMPGLPSDLGQRYAPTVGPAYGSDGRYYGYN